MNVEYGPLEQRLLDLQHRLIGRAANHREHRAEEDRLARVGFPRQEVEYGRQRGRLDLWARRRNDGGEGK